MTTKPAAKPEKKTKTKRTTKNRPRKRPVGQGEIEGPVESDGQLYFSSKDLLRFRLMESELASMQQAHQLLRLGRNELVRAHNERMAQHTAQMKEATRSLSAKAAEYEKLVRDIEAVYPFKLADIAFDPQTGKVTVLPKEPEKEVKSDGGT